MLKTVETSRAKKTKGVAVTYRAGSGEKYGTCPASCKMNCSGKGSEKIDAEYLAALLDAVPRKGVSFTYSHFNPLYWAHKLAPNKTTINYSADTLGEAVAICANKIAPVVTVVKESFWKNGKTATVERDDIPVPVRIVRCPAELRDISCADCGNGDPLCARLERDYIIGFTAHGPTKRKAGDPTQRGGCYADAGNCRIWWDQTANGDQPDETDGQKILRFAKSLPPRSIIRHHVAGDIGAE